jgi:hypothetical protein
MSACSQCGAVVKAGDRFCNVCGAPLAQPYAQPPATPGAGASPAAQPYAPQPGGPGAGAPVTRCQLGHEIPPGASYCAQGHPISLDQMQFANDPYGGAYSPQPAPAFAPPRPAAANPAPGGYVPAPQPVYTPPPPQAAYAAAYAAPGQQGFAPQPPAGGGYGPPPAGGGYVPPPAGGGYGPPPAGGGYVPPPAYPAAQPQAPLVSGDAPRDVAPPRALRGFLVAYGMNPSGDFWPLTGGRHAIGRLGSNDGLEIPLQDPTISSRHAAISVDAASGSIMVEDTGSTNGTFVNDEHIGYGGRRELRDGDRLRLGGFTTIVKVIGRV